MRAKCASRRNGHRMFSVADYWQGCNFNSILDAFESSRFWFINVCSRLSALIKCWSEYLSDAEQKKSVNETLVERGNAYSYEQRPPGATGSRRLALRPVPRKVGLNYESTRANRAASWTMGDDPLRTRQQRSHDPTLPHPDRGSRFSCRGGGCRASVAPPALNSSAWPIADANRFF